MASVARSGRRILIVEDDPRTRELLAAVLQHAGFETDAVKTGEEALSTVGVERPSLVLLDVCLPDMSGYSVCRALREQRPDSIPIIFLSGERTEWFDRVGGL